MRCATLFVVLCLCFSFSLSAQASGPEASGPSTPAAALPTLSETLGKLDALLSELSSEAGALSEDSERLKILLGQAQLELKTLSGRLDESRMQAAELSSSLKLSGESLATFAGSLSRWEKDHKVELWVTRGGVLAALALGFWAGRQ